MRSLFIWRALERLATDLVRARRRRLLAVVGLSLALGSCAKPNTVLLVNVEDDSHRLTTITHLKVKVTVGESNRELGVPEMPRLTLDFPTSFTIEMDRSLTGLVNVHIDALNASIQTLASGSATSDELNIGHTNTVTVHLGVPVPDGGGSDGGIDASDGGIDARDGGSDVGPGDAPGDAPTDRPTDGALGTGGTTGTGGMTGTGGTMGTGGMTGTGGTMGTGGMGTGGMGTGGMGTGGMGTGGMGTGGMGTGGMGAGGDQDAGDDADDGGAGGDQDAGDDADPDAPVD